MDPLATPDKARLTLTIIEAARVLGIGRGSCYALARSGRLPTVRLGRRLLVPRKALEAMVEVSPPAGGASR
jgi:excisionase family DNA binding protein